MYSYYIIKCDDLSVRLFSTDMFLSITKIREDKLNIK